ncbi:MAG: hypothetical protein FD138_700 [Planctomycetota bacterium]|nr:MAG: hypothetical protein FD138_700 [Planctomycetota bacterium]
MNQCQHVTAELVMLTDHLPGLFTSKCNTLVVRSRGRNPAAKLGCCLLKTSERHRNGTDFVAFRSVKGRSFAELKTTIGGSNS